MRNPLSFDRIAAGLAATIAIVGLAVVTFPPARAGVVSAPSGSLTASGVATNKILRTAADGTVTDVPIGSGLSLASDGTLSLSGGGGGGGGAPAVSYIALPSYGHVGGASLGYSTNLSALSGGMMLVPTNLLGTNRYFVQWRSAGQAMAFSNYQAINFTGAGRGAYSSSRTNAGFYELQIWQDNISGETNATLAGFDYSLAFAGGANASTNDLTGQITLTTGGIAAEAGLTNMANVASNLAVTYRSPAISYVALPASGIVGGATLAYSTNLSGDLTLTVSNLLSTNRYFIQWFSTGQKVTFLNAAAWYFADVGQGGYAESATNAGLHELQVWSDAVSGRTNAIYHARDYSLEFGPGIVATTNQLTMKVTLNIGVSSLTGGSRYSDAKSYFALKGRVVMNENFWGDTTSDGRYGDYYWARNGNTATAVWTNGGAPNAFGILAISPRTSGSGLGYGVLQPGGSSLPQIILTNSEVMVTARVMTSMLDSSSDTNVMRTGLGPSSALSEPAAGVYWRNSNNVMSLVTARSGSRTISDTPSNWTANAWYQLAWRIDSTGTNIYGYAGPNDDAMALVSTNSANIPGDVPLLPFLHSVRGLTNSTAGVTNFFDWYEIRAR